MKLCVCVVLWWVHRAVINHVIVCVFHMCIYESVSCQCTLLPSASSMPSARCSTVCPFQLPVVLYQVLSWFRINVQDVHFLLCFKLTRDYYFIMWLFARSISACRSEACHIMSMWDKWLVERSYLKHAAVERDCHHFSFVSSLMGRHSSVVRVAIP